MKLCEDIAYHVGDSVDVSLAATAGDIPVEALLCILTVEPGCHTGHITRAEGNGNGDAGVVVSVNGHGVCIHVEYEFLVDRSVEILADFLSNMHKI